MIFIKELPCFGGADFRNQTAPGPDSDIPGLVCLGQKNGLDSRVVPLPLVDREGEIFRYRIAILTVVVCPA